MTKIDDKIIDRIRKLLAMAKDTSSPNEAAIAARRAEAMMRQYNIESAEVILSDLKKPDGLVKQAARGNLWRKKARSIPKWSQGIAVLTAKLFDCHVVMGQTPETGWTMMFMGYKTDVEVAIWTYSYLLQQCHRFAEQYTAAMPHTNRAQRQSYHDGVAQGISDGLRKAKEAKDLADKGNSTSTALVVSKKSAIEERWGPIEYGKAKAKNVDLGAYYHGLKDGRSINVNPNVVEDKGNGTPAPSLPR